MRANPVDLELLTRNDAVRFTQLRGQDDLALG
jgi:hypothetical protein